MFREFIFAHPELVLVLATTVLWPLITGLASFGYHKLEERAPNLISYLRSAGLDGPRALDAAGKLFRALVARLLKTSPPPGGSAVLLLLALAGGAAGLTGCGSPMLVAVKAADGAWLVGDQARPVLEQTCIEPIPRATMAELAELRRVCDPAMLGYDSLRVAHVALRSAILAADAGTLDPLRLAPLVLQVGRAALALSESIRLVAGGR